MPVYHRPTSLAQGLDLLGRQPLQIVAGATDVYPARVAQQVWGRPSASADTTPNRQPGTAPDAWLDISAIVGLDQIVETEDEWRIGAMVTWSAMRQSGLPGCFDALRQAATEVGGLQIQNRATLAGNLCNASPAADGVPPLLCLDAEVELTRAGGTRRLKLQDFILGNRQTARQSDELLSAICIAKRGAVVASGCHSTFFKLGARKYLVISIVMAAIVIEIDARGLVADCRIAVGSCSAVATRLPELETALIGLSAIDSLADAVRAAHFDALAPISDIRADREYRLHAAREAVTTLLTDLSHPGAEFA